MAYYEIGDRIELEIYECCATEEELIKKGAKEIYKDTIYPYKGFHGTYYLKGKIIELTESLFMGHIVRDESDCNKYWVKIKTDGGQIIETRKTNSKLRKINV